MNHPSIRWAGPRALLIDVESLDAVLALHTRLVDYPLAGQVDVLAAAQTVLTVFDSRAHASSARATLGNLDMTPAAVGAAQAEPVRIEVVYDGQDLAEVGRLTGLGPDGVVAAHSGQTWTAAFGGFAPGFAYLVGENDTLHVPRRTSPRTAVPAGSVALAGNFSAVYPRSSPGGWQLIGRTSARMWDLDREPPALLRPGTKVQYVPVRELVVTSAQGAGPGGSAGNRPSDAQGRAGEDRPVGSNLRPVGGSPGSALEVVSPGGQSLIEDLGRPGFGDLGVPVSGAADTASARQANRLVGNPPGDAVIETILGGLEARAHGELTVALTGAPVSGEVRSGVGSRAAPMRAPFPLHDGEVLHLNAPRTGLRTYVSVRGGIDVPLVLGSRSTDVFSGTGPEPLSAGTVLPIGAAGPERTVGMPEPSTLPETILADGQARASAVVLRIIPGPRHDWFTPESRAALTVQSWLVTPASNRIGVRLDIGGISHPLVRARTEELPSEGVVAGSLQVPPSGLPVLFLADHPVTGGYPVIGVVIPEDLPVAAQLSPGTAVRFEAVDPVAPPAVAVAQPRPSLSQRKKQP